MTDYGHELVFGSFLTSARQDPQHVVALAQLSEQVGLDLVTFQDHPYQPALLDTWTLLSYVAAATVQVRLAPNVLNLPLRPPAMVARAAASLDLLSGGRLELGLGAGAFWDGIEAMGVPRLTPGDSVEALDEAIQVMRQLWDTTTRGGARLDGKHHRLTGAKRGPAPAHAIELWLGAYKPRMLRLTGRVADGWLPSSSYLPPAGLAAANAVIDEATLAAGRRPGDVRRLYNISGTFASGSDGFLQGPASQWVEELTELVVGAGMATLILASDDPQTLTRFAQEVAPAVREAVAAERAQSSAAVAAAPVELVDEPAPSPAGAASFPVAPAFPLTPTPDDGSRLTDPVWDETARPRGPGPEPGREYSPRDLAFGSS